MYLLQVDATDKTTDELTEPNVKKTKPALVYISFDENAARWELIQMFCSSNLIQ